MTDEHEDAETPAEFVDPIDEIQHVLARWDPDAMPLGVITIVEWMDRDGGYAMSVLNTPMPPWHMAGLMRFAEDNFDAAMGLADMLSSDFDDEN